MHVDAPAASLPEIATSTGSTIAAATSGAAASAAATSTSGDAAASTDRSIDESAPIVAVQSTNAAGSLHTSVLFALAMTTAAAFL